MTLDTNSPVALGVVAFLVTSAISVSVWATVQASELRSDIRVLNQRVDLVNNWQDKERDAIRKRLDTMDDKLDEILSVTRKYADD
ncbi:hypothetical protein L2750_14585 [Shewanella submarina]|uniref:Uncharacterized protein n=1 Tax=Shewanella submarina TaxID=2016376 RepID=A0ABV7G569_9GAMM|nr:hypothetical protein [Shewanella submarina]MCL1038358.1 hypothetical protein [Shewanella submarina]